MSQGYHQPDINLGTSGGAGQIMFSGATVQALKLLTSDVNGVQVGSLGLVTGSGNFYRAVTATPGGSTWTPCTGIWRARDFGVGLLASEIQAAHDEMQAVEGGGIVGLDAVDYDSDVQIVIDDNTIIRGSGMVATRILGNTRADAFIRTNAPGFAASPTIQRVVLQDFGVWKSAAPVVVGSVGVDVINAQDVVIERLDVRNIERPCRVRDESRSVFIRNCRVGGVCVDAYTFTNGVRSSKLDGCAVTGVHTNSVNVSAGADTNTSHLIVEDNSLNGFTNAGVLFGSTALNPCIQTDIYKNRIESLQAGAKGVIVNADTRDVNAVDNHYQSVDDDANVDNQAAFDEVYSRSNGIHNRIGFGSMVDNTKRGSLSDFAMLERERYAGFTEDWLSVDTGVSGQTDWQTVLAGTATVTWSTTLSDQEHPGIVQLTIPAGVANQASLRKGDSFVRFGGGRIRAQAIVQVNGVPDGVNPYDMRIGLGDSDNADFTDGVYFEATEGSANWQCKTADNGTRTTTDSGVPVPVATWQVLEVSVVGGSAQFFIDGVLVATIATNIPTGAARLCTPIMHIVRDGVIGGTGGRSLRCDFYQYGQNIENLR